MKKDLHSELIINCHGKAKGSSIFDQIRVIDKFIQKHPKEFIILKLKQEGKMIPGFCKNILCEMIIELFGEKLITQPDRESWFKVHKATIGDLRSRNKNILVVFSKDIFQDFTVDVGEESLQNPKIAESFLKMKGIFRNRKFILDQWFNQDKVNNLLEKVDQSFKKEDKTLFRVTHYIFSPQKKFKLIYLLNMPTIYKLEKNQFMKGSKVMNHIVGSIYNSLDINIGKFLFTNISLESTKLADITHSCQHA